MDTESMNYDGIPDSTKITTRPQQAPHARVEICFDQLREEIIGILDRDTSSQELVAKLQSELAVYKRAYSDLDAEKRQLEMLKEQVEKQRDDLDTQLKGHRVVTLVDGDGAIFVPQLIEQGQVGGHAAASKLTNSITQYLQTTIGSNHYQIWIYVFLNKRGLLDTFGRLGKFNARTKLDDFIAGFNQAAERFMVVDVGGAKEAADAKIKALLESEIRLSQTEKVIFGGSHDNGYVTTLRSQITAGFGGKLILLPSYTEIAAGIVELGLPTLDVPDLFISEKLGYPVSNFHGRATTPPAEATQSNKEPESNPRVPGQGSPEALPLNSAAGEAWTLGPRSPETNSFSSMVRASHRVSPPTPELESGGSSSSDGDDTTGITPASPPLPRRTGTRRINPKLPLSKQKPPPCTLFYISDCKHAKCIYGHDYILDAVHYAEIRSYAKKTPCLAMNKGEICTWGEICCYGHKCPYSATCHFLKQGRCKFTGRDMHKEPK